jgi:magnesium-transporting ATPase (P-type)
MPVEGLLRHFGIDLQRGLDAGTVQRAQAQHGPNALPEVPVKPLWRTFAQQFKSPLIFILFVAAGLAVALGHHGDAMVILAVVLVNALIGSFQEGRAERSMAALRRLAAVRVRVLRAGSEQVLEARALVPGDIVLLAAGDAVAADARLIETVQLQVAEAALTGESVPVSKSVAALPEATGLADRHNMVYGGTHVTSGRARAVVVATGVHTEVGRIAGLTEQAEEPKTPLELRLEQFGRALGRRGAGAVRAGGAAGPVARPAAGRGADGGHQPDGLDGARGPAGGDDHRAGRGHAAHGRRGAIIRRLSAVETLGSTTVICSDKTGTLTRNEMTVTRLWLPPQAGAPARCGRHRLRTPRHGCWRRASRRMRPTQRCGPARSGGAVQRRRTAAAGGRAQPAGPCWATPPKGRCWCWPPRPAGPEPVRRQAPRWRAALRLRQQADGHRHRSGRRAAGVIKGAPEAVLRLCARDARMAAGARTGGKWRGKWPGKCGRGMAGRALRVLALAEVDDAALDARTGFDALAGRARLLGLVGQIDPPREEVKLAVAECRRAGIRPVMVTGDHKLTGLAIAPRAGHRPPG